MQALVYVNGNFNGWCGDCNPMSDEDGDGVWTVTLPLDAGTIEYKFNVDGWNHQEMFIGGESCTINENGFIHRRLSIYTDTVLPVACWNSCDGCPDDLTYHDVKFRVNMQNEDVSADGVYLAGGLHFGSPGDNPMSDEDGDGIWSITMSLPEGTFGNYAFLNGNSGDWSGKEDLSGLDCADPANYNDRILAPVMGTTSIEHLLRSMLY